MKRKTAVNGDTGTIRVLHLFSNHKVTGPAELALDTSRAVERSTNGLAVESYFLPGRHPRDQFWIGELAQERQVRLVELPGLRLAKHFNPFRAMRDSRILARYLESGGIDLVHCHLQNDHVIASLAVAGLPPERRPAVVRTVYDNDLTSRGWRARRTLRRYADRIVCFSTACRERLINGPLEIRTERVALLDAPIDVNRFDPARKSSLPDERRSLGIEPTAFTAGIVARMQRHRRFEILLDAIQRVRAEVPGFRFVIVGRGTHQAKVARDPVREMGLDDTVVFAGHITGDAYVPTLMTMDVKVFLVPGSDGTCRAVREALASGIPVIAADRGMLPELVEDGITGRIVDDTPEKLAAALVSLANDRNALHEMSRRARKRAVERFSYERYARALVDIYRDVLERGPSR